IKTPQGSLRLKIPVEQHIGDLIMNVKTKDFLGWKEKHIKTIEANYKKSAFFSTVFDDYVQLIDREYANLSEMNTTIINFILAKFGVETKIIKSSELNISSIKEEKVMDICNALHATTYYSGTGAKAYQSENDFNNRGLQLKYSV
ncbi:WbqC family protein, partial [bacterium]|nr:WbqC family protein [bacterium]